MAAYRRLGAGPVAVRSSAEEEDSATRSYAGQFDTFLDISGEEQVFEAVKACRASALGRRVASYREEEVGPPPRISVIVQRMIRPDYAGVAFAEPSGATLIEGVPALAERLVSGRASPSPLREDLRARVERVALEVVERFRGAQDLEWATEGDRVWLLQARPLTARLPAALPDRFRLWTAANVQEAIPRPLTPFSEELTMANLLRIFRASYAFGGLPQPVAPPVRFVNGRVYMSYSAMAEAMSVMPGFRIENLLLMFGDSPTLAPLVSYRPGPRRYFLLRFPATIARAISWLLFAERYIERGRKAVDQFVERVSSTLAGDPTDAQLLEPLASRETWDSLPVEPMSVTTGLANRLLSTLMEQAATSSELLPADAAALAVAGDIASLEPVQRLAALAAWLRSNPGRLDDDPEVQARLTEFMEVCGCRCEEEAELAIARWVERPGELLRLARQLASAPAGSPDAAARPATAVLRPRLSRRLRFLAAQARIWQRRRERTRAILARVGPTARLLLLTIGRRLCDRKLLHAPDDIFYLHRGEIVSLLEASASDMAHAELVASTIERRRAHHRRMLTWPPPPRLLAELPDGRLVPYEVDPGGDALQGFGASPGRVTGRARVVRDLTEAGALTPGEILVTRTTDIGWTPLFRLAAAVVTEIGAPTSHAAIVARELGVPAVVNIDHITDRVCNGDELFVDGWAGLVRRKGASGDGGTPTDGG